MAKTKNGSLLNKMKLLGYKNVNVLRNDSSYDVELLCMGNMLHVQVEINKKVWYGDITIGDKDITYLAEGNKESLGVVIILNPFDDISIIEVGNKKRYLANILLGRTKEDEPIFSSRCGVAIGVYVYTFSGVIYSLYNKRKYIVDYEESILNIQKMSIDDEKKRLKLYRFYGDGVVVGDRFNVLSSSKMNGEAMIMKQV
jgi:hypothetical protein